MDNPIWEIDPENPDLLIYSSYGTKHLEYSCHKLFYSGENERIHWSSCDFAIGFDRLNRENYVRIPNWAVYPNIGTLSPCPNPETELKRKTNFCSFVVSNPHAKKRIEFYNKLSEYKPIQSGGKVLNNVGGPVKDKLQFLQSSKFNIAFENSQSPGYVTEKIVEAFLSHSVPIYWGAPDVDLDFNPKSFINVSNFNSDEEAIEYIKHVDQNDELYLDYLSQNPLLNAKSPEYTKDEYLKAFLLDCISKIKTTKPISKTFTFKLYTLRIVLKKLEYRVNTITGHMKGFR